MRINSENKSMDMEARDINYILPAYVRSYQFYSKNELPTKIIFPMFASVRAAGVDIPIEWVPPLEAVAIEIAKDGKNVAEVTEEQEAVIDKKDEEIKKLKEEVVALTPAIIPAEGEPPPVSPAKTAFAEPPATTPPSAPPAPDRQPKQPPGGDIGPGQSLSDMHARDRRDQIQTTKDLVEDPDIGESPNKPFEKEISRDAHGRPVVEEKPNAPS